TFFKIGHRTVLGGSVAGSVGEFSHFMSGEYETQRGVYPHDGVDRTHVRGNFNVSPLPSLQIEVNSGYMASDLDLFGEGQTALGPLTQGLLGQPSSTGWLS